MPFTASKGWCFTLKYLHSTQPDKQMTPSEFIDNNDDNTDSNNNNKNNNNNNNNNSHNFSFLAVH